MISIKTDLALYLTMCSTFGGNPLASAVAIASLEVIKDERLAERYDELLPSFSSLFFVLLMIL